MFKFFPLMSNINFCFVQLLKMYLSCFKWFQESKMFPWIQCGLIVKCSLVCVCISQGREYDLLHPNVSSVQTAAMTSTASSIQHGTYLQCLVLVNFSNASYYAIPVSSGPVPPGNHFKYVPNDNRRDSGQLQEVPSSRDSLKLSANHCLLFLITFFSQVGLTRVS